MPSDRSGGAESESDSVFSLMELDESLRLWLLALGSALLAGLIGWGAGENIPHFWHWEEHLERAAEGIARDPFEARNQAEMKNTALAMGVLGGVTGLLLGLAGGMSRGAIRLAVIAGTAGLLLGITSAVAVSLMIVPMFFRSISLVPNPTLPLLVHSGIYASIGGAGGLSFGFGRRGLTGALRGLLAGTTGAILGSIVYNMLHTTAFPLESDYSPLPGKGVSRMIAHICVNLLFVICVVIAVQAPSKAIEPEHAVQINER
jgi:hypothetical protein